jgi:hypothetical protein
MHPNILQVQKRKILFPIVRSYQYASQYFVQHCHQNDILSRWRNTWLAYLRMSQMGEAVCNIDAVELSHVCINDTMHFKLTMVLLFIRLNNLD